MIFFTSQLWDDIVVLMEDLDIANVLHKQISMYDLYPIAHHYIKYQPKMISL